MSSSSSSSNLALEAQNVGNTKCGCGFERMERTSWTPKHPARRFWNCPNSLVENVGKCKYFLWKDNKLNDQYYKDVLMEMKAALDAKEKASEVNKCLKKIFNLEVLMAKEKEAYEIEKFELEKEKVELQKVLMEVRGVNGRLSKTNELLKKMVMVLMVIVGVCCMLIWYG